MQRVGRAVVGVGGQPVAAIGRGLCVLVGVTHSDQEEVARRLADKVWRLRVFPDDAGQTNCSASDLGLPILVVSQFTLYADTRRGRRPSFTAAALPDRAAALIDVVVAELRRLGASVQTGVFGAQMALDLRNDGPFTVVLEL